MNMRNAPEWVERPKNPNEIPPQINHMAMQNYPKLQNSLENSYNLATKNIANISQETRFKVLGGSISTHNDNYFSPGKHGYLGGVDDGKSFGFAGNISMEYNGRPWNLSATMDSYTSNPDIINKKTGQFIGNNADFRGLNYEWDTKQRIDRGMISLDTKSRVFENHNTTVDVKYGGGLSYTGNLAWENIQNKWHSVDGVADYYVHAPYEKRQWIGGHVNLGVDAKYKLNEIITVGARADARIRAFGEGKSSFEGVTYASIKWKYAELEWGIGQEFQTRDTSATIAWNDKLETNPYAYVKAAIGTENIKAFYEHSTQGRTHGTIGIQFGKRW